VRYKFPNIIKHGKEKKNRNQKYQVDYNFKLIKNSEIIQNIKEN
jgi:hypothetical protein